MPTSAGFKRATPGVELITEFATSSCHSLTSALPLLSFGLHRCTFVLREMGVNYAKLERDNGAGEDLQAGLNPVMREEFALSGYDDDCKT